MKKIRLPQPYATMVSLGLLQTLPDIWGDVEHGEKIFVYADNLADEIIEGPDYTKPLHRKIYNELFLGNLLDFEELPTQCFIGSVRAYHSGELTEGWSDRYNDFIFVAVPRTFKTYVKDFNVSDAILDESKSKYVTIKTIERRGRRLFVPVGKNIWQVLKDRVRCVDVVMFWESYMKAFAPLLFSMVDETEEITDIHFKRSSHTLSFATEDGISQAVITVKGTKECVFTLDFNLAYRMEGTTIVDIGPSAKINAEASDELISEEPFGDVVEEEEDEVYTKKKRPYIRFISTPMGGMTRWKR